MRLRAGRVLITRAGYDLAAVCMAVAQPWLVAVTELMEVLRWTEVFRWVWLD